MKKILLVALLGLAFGRVMSADMKYDMISSLTIPTDTTWEVIISYGYHLPDSVKLISNGDTVLFMPTSDYPSDIYSKYNASDTISSNNNQKLSLHPQQGKLVVYIYSSYNDNKYKQSDSVIYGNLPNATCPSLGGTRTFHHQNVAYYTREIWISENDKDDIRGFTWQGVLYDMLGNKVRNVNATIEYYAPYKTYSLAIDENGIFSCKLPDSPTNFIILKYNKIRYEISPLQVYGKIGETTTTDIHILHYLNNTETVSNNQLSINSSNNTSIASFITNEAAQLSVYALGGHCVFSQSVSPANATQELVLGTLPAGMYVCKMYTASNDGLGCLFVVQ